MGVVCCVSSVSNLKHGIFSKRFELEDGNFVWCFLMTWKPSFSSRKKIQVEEIFIWVALYIRFLTNLLFLVKIRSIYHAWTRRDGRRFSSKLALDLATKKSSDSRLPSLLASSPSGLCFRFASCISSYSLTLGKLCHSWLNIILSWVSDRSFRKDEGALEGCYHK